MPVDSSQDLALSRAKESLCYLIVLPSVLPPGGRIKDFSVQGIFGNDTRQWLSGFWTMASRSMSSS